MYRWPTKYVKNNNPYTLFLSQDSHSTIASTQDLDSEAHLKPPGNRMDSRRFPSGTFSLFLLRHRQMKISRKK